MLGVTNIKTNASVGAASSQTSQPPLHIDTEGKTKLDAQAPPPETKSKWASCLSRIGNSSIGFFFTQIKEQVRTQVGKVFQLFTTKASTPAPASAPKAADEVKPPQNMRSLKDAFSVTPQRLLGELLNAGNIDDKNGKLLYNYLVTNPTSHLLGGDRIVLQGDRLFFTPPIQLSRQGNTITHITIGDQHQLNNDFSGIETRHVLHENRHQPMSLNALCQTINDRLSFLREAPPVEASPLSGEYGDRIKAFMAQRTNVVVDDHVNNERSDLNLSIPTAIADVDRRDIPPVATTVEKKMPPRSSSQPLSLDRRSVTPGKGSVKAAVERYEQGRAKPKANNGQVYRPDFGIDFQERKQKIDAAFNNAANKKKGGPLAT